MNDYIMYGAYRASARKALMEKMTRDFERKKVKALEARRARLTVLEDDSSLRWGGPSQFRDPNEAGGGVSISIRTTPEQPWEDPERPVRLYTEIDRNTVTVKVYNPEDEEMWIEVERILRITFQGTDGYDHVFQLNWDSN